MEQEGVELTGSGEEEHQQTTDEVYQPEIMGSELPRDVPLLFHAALLCCPS